MGNMCSSNAEALSPVGLVMALQLHNKIFFPALKFTLSINNTSRTD
jgi:hypothetical protein